MISITNSKETITICKVESMEVDVFNHQFIINGYVMERQGVMDPVDKIRSTWDCKAHMLRNSILDILHGKMNGKYKIAEDLTLKKITKAGV